MIIDEMAAMRSLKAKDTYKHWFHSLLKFVSPVEDTSALSIEIINDTYRIESVKSGIRNERGETSKRVHLQGPDQQMVQGNNWINFFNNIENKNDLIKTAAEYYCSFDGRRLLSTPLIFTHNEKTWRATRVSLEELLPCNHEEADTRMVLHCCIEDTNVVVVSKDTDVLILLVHAFTVTKPQQKWYMKIDHQKYVDIGAIC